MGTALSISASETTFPPAVPDARARERRVLVLAPTGNDARLTTQILAQAGIAVHACRDVVEMRRELEAQCGALLLAEEILQVGSVPALLGALAGQPKWSDLPVIIITSGGEADQARLRRLAMFGPGGNVTLLERPFRPGTLTSAVQAALRARQRQYEVRDLLQSVRASEEQYHHILASISDAFIAVGADWRITYVNAAYLQLVAPLRFSADDLLGQDFWKTLPIAPEFTGRFRRAMAEQKPDSLEVFYRPLQVWLDVRIFPSPAALTIYLRDITERKRRQDDLIDLAQKIRDQARTFDATLSHITDFAYTFDRLGRFTYVNKPLLDLWGLKLEQAVGKDFFELNYPRDLAWRLQRQIQEVFHTRKPLRDETEYTNPAGETGYYEYIFNPVLAADGSVEAVAGSTRDITERKRTEQRLRHSDAQVTSIINHSPIGIYLVDSQLRIQQVNRKALPVFGDISDPVGRSIGEIMRVLWPPAAAADIEARFRHTLESGESYFESGFNSDRIDRTVREHYDWEIHRVVLPDGKFGVVCYFIDISSHVAAQQKIRDAHEASQQANRAKDDFLAALSHELRTPLNPVLLLATEAAANPAVPAGLRADFDTIAKNVLLEARLINDLLDLTRITRGNVVLDSRPVAAHPILRDAIANVNPELQEKRLNLTVEFGAGDPVVLGDPVRLQQVFWNVLKNAAKFTAEGGDITVRTNPGAGLLRIEFTDTGAGMTPAEISRIFDAFAQGDHAAKESPHRFGGLGLGLAISRSLLELQGGHIEAASAGLGQGSTFTIELPLAPRPAAPDTDGRTGDSSPPGTATAVGRKRILLVEDHNPTRLVLTHLLRSRKHTVTAASSVAEARQAAQGHAFDLLITDIGLPDGNGYELMEEIAKSAGIPGVALTGYGAEQHVERAQKAGFVAHLTKPVSIRALDAVLRSVK